MHSLGVKSKPLTLVERSINFEHSGIDSSHFVKLCLVAQHKWCRFEQFIFHVEYQEKKRFTQTTLTDQRCLVILR